MRSPQWSSVAMVAKIFGELSPIPSGGVGALEFGKSIFERARENSSSSRGVEFNKNAAEFINSVVRKLMLNWSKKTKIRTQKLLEGLKHPFSNKLNN